MSHWRSRTAPCSWRRAACASRAPPRTCSSATTSCAPCSSAARAADVQISLDIVVIGAFTGLAYAVMGAGLVLIYRSTRVINFAQGEIGALAAAVLAKLVLDLDWN